MGNMIISVPNDQLAAVECCGKFKEMKQPGCHFLGPDLCNACITVRYIGTRIMEKRISCETKTEDNVFVRVSVAVQYEVLKAKAYDAIYKLNDPHHQIESYVTNVIRSRVPKLTLDNVFAAKDEIAMAVKQDLEHAMTSFGFFIHNTLVTDIDPDNKVKHSMNEINANKRLRIAATERAEADKILMVKAAEAEAESKFLQGQGIAKQRAAIVDGLKNSLGSDNEHLSAKSVTELLLITQYFDTLEKMSQGKGTTVFMPHNVGSVNDIAGQLRMGIMEAEAGKPEKGQLNMSYGTMGAHAGA